jgi:hypothetical protein
MVIFASNKKAAVKVFKKYAKKNIVKVIHEHEDGSVLFNII